MTRDANRGPIAVFMVRHAGFPKDGNKSRGAFQKAARERFGGSRKCGLETITPAGTRPASPPGKCRRRRCTR
ncbi:MAG: hypothetical protein ACRELF_01260, partial [Gemmataceae bacterium]